MYGSLWPHELQHFPIYHQLPELAQTHVHLVGDAIQPSHPLLSPYLPALNLSQHQGLFQCPPSTQKPLSRGGVSPAHLGARRDISDLLHPVPLAPCMPIPLLCVQLPPVPMPRAEVGTGRLLKQLNQQFVQAKSLQSCPSLWLYGL